MVSTHIDKLDFLAVYPIARDKAFTDDAIRNKPQNKPHQEVGANVMNVLAYRLVLAYLVELSR
jgi:hypothetical protein